MPQGPDRMFDQDEDLTHRVTVRMRPSEWAQVVEAGKVLGMEPSRFMRRAALRTLKELAPEIQRRKEQQREIPL